MSGWVLALLEDLPPGEAPAPPKLQDRFVSNGANASDFTGAGEAPALSPSSFTLRSVFAGGSSASEAVAAGSGRSCPRCSEGEAPDAGGPGEAPATQSSSINSSKLVSCDSPSSSSMGEAPSFFTCRLSAIAGRKQRAQ